jgi:hypothetical protein
MADCPRIEACPLFKAFSVKSSLKVWQAFFCQGAFQNCERYKLVVQGKPVALQLLPNGRMLEVPLDQLETHHLA